MHTRTKKTIDNRITVLHAQIRKIGEGIWENDILMCHGNPDDLVKAVFGEFNVIEVESEEVIDSVIGWHYEVIPTDELSKCEPFCYSMPLTDTYIKLNEMEVVGNVFDNPELLEKAKGDK